MAGKGNKKKKNKNNANNNNNRLPVGVNNTSQETQDAPDELAIGSAPATPEDELVKDQVRRAPSVFISILRLAVSNYRSG